MVDKPAVPDYALDESLKLTTSAQVQAVGHPLRSAILGLLHERAATVTELAIAVGRPKSTVAYHVNVLQEAGLVRVVRTRRVRAIEERYFGRTARMFFYVGLGDSSATGAQPMDLNDLDLAGRESQQAYQAGRLWSFVRHARIPPERAAEFWDGAMSLVQDFDQLPRAGTMAYGFVVGIYPIPDYPVLPEPAPERGPGPESQSEP
jgi:DNA-binding transcriptional ArsR family regulator